MSDSNHSPDGVWFVTVEDAHGPYLCECGRPAPLHDSIVYPYLCPNTPDQVRRTYWEKVVRREIAKELAQFASTEAQEVLVVPVETITERIREIING